MMRSERFYRGNCKHSYFKWCRGIFLLAFVLSLVVPFPSQAIESSPQLVIETGGHTGTMGKLIFSPDGNSLISIGMDKTVRIWDLKTGDLDRVVRGYIGNGPEGALATGALSPDGRWLAVGGQLTSDVVDGPAIRVIDLELGEVGAVLRGHSDVIESLSFSENWLLASSSGDGDVRVWNMESLQNTAGGGDLTKKWESSVVLRGHSMKVFLVELNPTGDHAVSVGNDEQTILWKLDARSGTHSHVANLSGHEGAISWATFSPDGRYLATGGVDKKLFLRSASDGSILKELSSDMGLGISTISFSPDGSRLIASSQDGSAGTTSVFECASGSKILDFPLHDNMVRVTAWHPTKDLVATGGGNDNDIFVWSPDVELVKSNNAVVQHFVGRGRPVWAVGFSKSKPFEVGIGKNFDALLGGSRFEESFDFTRFELSSLDPVASESLFRRTIDSFKGNALRSRTLTAVDVGSLGTIDYGEMDGNMIRTGSFTPDGSKVILGSRFNLAMFEKQGGGFALLQNFIGHTSSILSLSPSIDGKYLVSASHDQTIRLWSVESGALLASLFVDTNREWVCWTPSGHYHASAGGERYIGWHVNNGIEKLARFYPSSVFRDQFHSPELVKRTIELGNFDQAFAAVGENQKAFDDILPPEISWVSPVKRSTSGAQSKMLVQANITSPKSELEEIKLLLNGKAVTSNVRASGNVLSFEREVDLLPGENRLAIFARNGNSGSTSDERIVLIGNDPAPSTPGETPDSLDEILKPDLYVLSVGVSEYEDESVPALQYCDDDAEAIAEVFRNQSGKLFDKTEVRILTNEDASEEGVQDSLDWLEENATQKDFVVIFLAAHGLNDEKGNFYLLPHDANPAKLRTTGVAWDDFGEILGNLPSRVLMFLDTCHSGQLGANLFTLANVDGVRGRSVGGLKSAFDPSEAIRELTSDENGVVIMAASTGSEESLESDEWGHGAFTMGLLEGFESGADVNKDGVIHLRELDFFVSDRVKELTKGKQHPTTVKPSTISRLPVAAVK